MALSVFRCVATASNEMDAKRLGIRWAAAVLLGISAVWSTSASAGVEVQTDWSSGPKVVVSVDAWDGAFESAEGISWLAIPGQITLSGGVLVEPEKHLVSDGFLRPSSLDVADLDDDGDPDIVGAAFGGSRVNWWRNEGGSPPVWVESEIEAGFRDAASVKAADVNGDGHLDVVGCAWTDAEMVVWYNDGGALSWTRQSVATGLGHCHWVDVADLDGDGDADLLGAAAAANTVAIWLNDGAQDVSWTPQVIDGDYRGARSLVPADLDHDGDVDLIGTALDDDDLSWWRNDGGDPLVWTRKVVSDSLPGSHHADAWDMDLDGDLDLVAAGFQHPYLRLWWNDGEDEISWEEEEIGGPILGPLVIAGGDLDGDGDMDMAATSNNWDRVMWWQNDGGPPSGWSASIIERNFDNAWPLAIADLDGDGSLDVISGASGATEVAWWQLTGFVLSGVITSNVLEIPEDAVTVECSLEADTPVGTEVTIEVRTGSTVDDLGPWVPLALDLPTTVMARGPALLQYRLRLATSDPDVAPLVRSVTFEWTSAMPSRPSSGGRVGP